MQFWSEHSLDWKNCTQNLPALTAVSIPVDLNFTTPRHQAVSAVCPVQIFGIWTPTLSTLFQQCGIDKQLVEWGLQQAQRERAPVGFE
jgi:hypothetical protein